MELLNFALFAFIVLCYFKSISSAALSSRHAPDQQFAERKFVHPFTMSGLLQYPSSVAFRKSVSRLHALSEKDVCDLDPKDVSEVCSRTTAILNRWTPEHTVYQTLTTDRTPDACSTQEVHLQWVRAKVDFPTTIRARPCPTTPQIWISQGNEKNEIFIYTRDSSRDDENSTPPLRLQDYLFFVD